MRERGGLARLSGWKRRRWEKARGEGESESAGHRHEIERAGGMLLAKREDRGSFLL